jgi:chemotaxis signal transduction protein
MLCLLFEAAELRCAIPCAGIDEVLPLTLLEPAPGTGGALAGLLAFRGSMLPVLDAGLLLTGTPSPRKLSTRLVVIAGPRRLALICAGAHDVQALEALPEGAQELSAHALIARVMLAGGRPVHCLALEQLPLRLLQLRGEEGREGARTTA